MFDIFNSIRKNHDSEPFQVTRQTVIGDILDLDSTTAPYFMEIGNAALDCPGLPRLPRGEALEEACAVHGVDWRCSDPEAERPPGEKGPGLIWAPPWTHGWRPRRALVRPGLPVADVGL